MRRVMMREREADDDGDEGEMMHEVEGEWGGERER